jgi:hypothetical protein
VVIGADGTVYVTTYTGFGAESGPLVITVSRISLAAQPDLVV